MLFWKKLFICKRQNKNLIFGQTVPLREHVSLKLTHHHFEDRLLNSKCQDVSEKWRWSIALSHRPSAVVFGSLCNFFYLEKCCAFVCLCLVLQSFVNVVVVLTPVPSRLKLQRSKPLHQTAPPPLLTNNVWEHLFHAEHQHHQINDPRVNSWAALIPITTSQWVSPSRRQCSLVLYW